MIDSEVHMRADGAHLSQGGWCKMFVGCALACCRCKFASDQAGVGLQLLGLEAHQDYVQLLRHWALEQITDSQQQPIYWFQHLACCLLSTDPLDADHRKLAAGAVQG